MINRFRYNQDFAVTQHEGKTTWTFRFPSCDEIDFVKEIEAHKKKYGPWKPSPSPEQQKKVKNRAKKQRKKR